MSIKPVFYALEDGTYGYGAEDYAGQMFLYVKICASCTLLLFVLFFIFLLLLLIFFLLLLLLLFVI